MNSNFFEKVSDKKSELRKSEKKVLEYILKNPYKITQESITGIAKNSETSETTVNRLCHSLGYSGFGQMKLALMHDVVSDKIKNIPEDIVEKDDLRTIMKKLGNSFISVIGKTQEIIDYSELKRAIETILKAEKIYFYGIGGSGHIAEVAHHLFLKASIFNTSYCDGYMQAVSASLLTRRDLAIGISHSGRTRDVIEAIKIAKNNGAMTIVITGNMESNIIDYADIKLFTSSKEEPLYGDFMEAKISQLFIIDLLYIGILLKNVPIYVKHLEDTAEAIRGRWT